MLSKQRRQEILENLAYNDLKLERGSISNYHVYERYKRDVEDLLAEVVRLEMKVMNVAPLDEVMTLDEWGIEQRTDEVLNMVIEDKTPKEDK